MGKAKTTRKLFSRETSIDADIAAPPERVWSVLTDAGDFARWNSTVVSLSGEIAPEGRLELVSTLAPKRTFTLRVQEFLPPRRLVWGDALGRRVFTLEKTAAGTRLSMCEKIGGPLFPLFSRMIPPFDQAFEQFVADLARESTAART
ncbi:MAG: SRPBCC domain-containing protein [Acidimicrobiales bacterium]|nr:SRPBCC domain-containing protein [Acidimicrobiales bacterium]